MLHLFVGADEYLKSEGAKRVIDALVPPADRDFGLEIVDGACDRADEALEAIGRTEEAARTPSFLGGNKVVWRREANFLPGAKGRAAEAQAVREAAAAFVERLAASPLPEGHHLIVTAAVCPKNTKLHKLAEKTGEVRECGAPLRPWEVEKAAQERLAEALPAAGLRMAPPVRAAFAKRVGADTRTLVSELRKLRDYIGKAGAEVTLRDVEAVTSVSVGTEPFALSEALLARSPGAVARAVALLRTDKNAAFAAAAVMLNTLNDLCAIRDALDRGWLAGNRWEIPADRLPARLARLSGWALGKQAEAAKRYSLNELRAGRHHVVEMRFKLVDATAQDPWAIIEPAALRVVMRRVRR